jgi:putative membrane protein
MKSMASSQDNIDPQGGHQKAQASATASAANMARKAAQSTSVAATQTADAAQAAKSSAERTTELAADRTALALERTYAAWVRTGLFALASGIGAPRLLNGVVPDWMGPTAAVILLAFSAFCFVAGVWRHLFQVQDPAPAVPRIPTNIFVVVNGFLALVAVAALCGIVLGGGPR